MNVIRRFRFVLYTRRFVPKMLLNRRLLVRNNRTRSNKYIHRRRKLFGYHDAARAVYTATRLPVHQYASTAQRKLARSFRTSPLQRNINRRALSKRVLFMTKKNRIVQ